MSSYHEMRNREVTRRTEAAAPEPQVPEAPLPPQVFTHRHGGKPCSGELVQLEEGRFCIGVGIRVSPGELVQ